MWALVDVGSYLTWANRSGSDFNIYKTELIKRDSVYADSFYFITVLYRVFKDGKYDWILSIRL